MRNNIEHDPSELGELERELLELVWQNAGMSADALRVRLGRPLKDSTVRTVLKRLEEKGYLTHTVDQRTFLFHAAQPREIVVARAVKRVADWFCNGSMEDLLVGMVSSKQVGRNQLLKLSELIAVVRKEEKS